MRLLCVFILSIIFVQVIGIARAPVPFCVSKPLYKQLPLSADEILSHDMATAFTGYNLNVQLATNNSFATMSKKYSELDRKNSYFPGIISHYVEQSGNGVGKDSFLLYKDMTGSIHFTYGVIKSKDVLPQTNSTAVITVEKNINCFDAALFLDHGLAIIDCMKLKTNQTQNQNLFYVLDLTTHTIKTILQNDMFVDFDIVTKRKLMKFSHPEAGGFTYLMRSYFADGVDKANADNTYLELFSVPNEDPTKLEILSIIDRSMLGIPKLQIYDVELYLDDLFLLDYETGLFRLDIIESQRLQVTARYRDFGFTKFAVYSDDLENELIIALANSHTVYEINWQILTNPTLITKYSLLESSRVKQVMMNDRYIIVQSAAYASNETVPKFQIDYTWIFSKNSRTYANAYHIIQHNSSIVEIELDRESDRIYIADEKGLSLHQIGEARLIFHNTNEDLIGKNDSVVIIAESMDYYSNLTFKCQESFNVFFVSRENMKIWPTGITVPSTYSTNFPGLIQIPLEDYFIGANMTYTLVDHQGLVLPQSLVNKINRTYVTFDQSPRAGDITYFHSDVVPELGRQIVIYYYEDTSNTTHVAQCVHTWFSSEMRCLVVAQYNHTSKIRSLATAFYYDENGWKYYYMMVLEGSKKTVRIFDFQQKQMIANITYTGDLDAQISSISTSNGYMYVLRKYVKTIDVYDLAKCQEFGTCKVDFIIDASLMKSLNVHYFAPQQIITDRMHPEVLFIKCLGSLVILDVDNKRKIHLLDEIISPLTSDPYFKVAVNKYRLLLVAQPDLMHEYSLEHVYSRNMVTFVKVMPTYGYIIQPNADVEFSDFDNTVYINAVDRKSNISAVLIFRLGYPGTNCLYSVVTLPKLYSRPGFQIEVSGFVVDFVTIVANGDFQLYRVFQYPFITVNNSFFDYSFKIFGKNMVFYETTDEVNVTVVNSPEEVKPTKIFNDTVNSLRLDRQGHNQLEDRQWFTGSVIHYNYTCDECHGENRKVRVREHIDNFMNLHVGGNSYTQTMRGGISVWGDLFRFRPNGTVADIINLPDQKYLQTCLKVASTYNQIFAVTACQNLGQGINLYVTSMASFKSFTWGPFRSLAYNVRSLQIVNDIAMVVDTSANPEFKFEQGAVYLYRVSFNHENGEQMNEIEVIDSNDFVACHGWDQDEAYLGNAHLFYSSNTNAYRLYVTEVTNGLFVVDFLKAPDSDDEINILSTSFIDLNKVLATFNFHMPNDAIFLSVTFVSVKFNPHFDTENVLVTTKGYHNFEFTILYDDKGQIASTVLHRVYYRYGFYNALNQVKATNGFIAIGYTIPSAFGIYANYKKQYIAIYDTLDYPFQSQKGYSERYMIGAFPLNSTTPAVFAFNTTYDWHTNGTRIGLVIAEPRINVMFSTSIAHNLSLQLLPGCKNQALNMTAFNDFGKYSFIVQVSGDDEGSSTIIIIIIVLCSIVIVFFGLYIYSQAKRKPRDQKRESLLTESETVARQSLANTDSYIPPTQGQEATKKASVTTAERPSGNGSQMIRQSHSQEALQIEPEVEQAEQEEEKQQEQEKDVPIENKSINVPTVQVPEAEGPVQPDVPAHEQINNAPEVPAEVVQGGEAQEAPVVPEGN